MYTLQEIKSIHLETTEKCNLSCLMCGRNTHGGLVNQYLNDNEITLDDIKKLPKSFIKNLDNFFMCGNYGEPILAKDTLAIFKYLRSINKNISLRIMTNGCARSSFWWEELAYTIDKARFGIDGLEDTHKIYRKNASWNKIIQNAKTFIDAGGYAIWDFLVFQHNEHQIDEARDLYKQQQSVDAGFLDVISNTLIITIIGLMMRMGEKLKKLKEGES